MTTYDGDDENEFPYEEGHRELDTFNSDVFDNMEQAQEVLDWLYENWNPSEGGYSADDAFDRLIGVDIIYNEDGEIEHVHAHIEGSP